MDCPESLARAEADERMTTIYWCDRCEAGWAHDDVGVVQGEGHGAVDPATAVRLRPLTPWKGGRDA